MADLIQPVMQQAATLQMGQTGVSGQLGSPQAPILRREVVRDPTLDRLLQLGQQVMAPIIEKKEAELFLAGAQRVSQGEALKDIIDEQPWYTNIFGQSASVQGARATAQVAQVDKFGTDLMADMDTLATISPADIGAEVNRRMAAALTGDPISDAVIQQKMVETSSTFYKAHIKANYKHVQDTMQAATVQTMMSAATLLGEAGVQRFQGTLSDSDWAQFQSNAAQALAPRHGQSAASYWGGLEQAVVEALATDNHHFVGMVFDSGVLDSAPSDLKVKLIDERRKREDITRETAGFVDFGPQLAMIQAQSDKGLISPKQAMDAVEGINAAFSMKYGIAGPMVEKNTMVSMLTRNLKSIYSKQEANAKAAATANADLAKEQAKRMDLMAGVGAGLGDILIAAGHSTDDVHMGIFSAIAMKRDAGEDWGAFVAKNYNEGLGHTNKYLQGQIKGALDAATGAGYSGEAFDRAHSLWSAVHNAPQGQAAARALLGTDAGLQMEKYDQFIQAGVPKDQAYQAAFGAPVAIGKRFTNKEVQEVVTAHIDKLDPGFFGKIMGEAPLSKSAKELLSAEMSTVFTPLVNGLGYSEKTAAQQALTTVLNTRVDVVGGLAYRKNPGDKDFAALIGADKDEAGKQFMAAVGRLARQQGFKGFKDPNAPRENIGPVLKDKDGRIFYGETEMGKKIRGTFINAWNAIGVEQEGPSYSVVPSPIRKDPETGLDYRTFSVNGVDEDGNTMYVVIDSRDVRKAYESGTKFKK